VKVLTFFIKDVAQVGDFYNWLNKSQDRIESKDVGMIFKSLNAYRERKLFILSFDYILPAPLPAFFFKSTLRRALRKNGVLITFVNYKLALIYITVVGK
jgi:hypothetical protein